MKPRRPNFRTLDLNLLKVFDVVMVERNVTRAATRLAMTQPAVSNALRRLRESINEELFVPTSSGVIPTAHAQTLWLAVRASLDNLQDALEPQGFDPRVDAHTFTVAMADATAAVFAPVLADHLVREPTRVEFRLVPLGTRDPRAMLEQGQADVGVGFFPEVAGLLAAEGELSAMQCERLYACEYVCVMRRDHPLAREGALTLESYCAAQHVRVSFAKRQRGYVDEALTRLGRERHILITANEFSTAAAAVHRSDLLTVLPRSFVSATGFASSLAVCSLPFEMPSIEVSLLWHGRHAQDTAQRWLRGVLRRAADAVSGQTPVPAACA